MDLSKWLVHWKGLHSRPPLPRAAVLEWQGSSQLTGGEMVAGSLPPPVGQRVIYLLSKVTRRKSSMRSRTNQEPSPWIYWLQPLACFQFVPSLATKAGGKSLFQLFFFFPALPSGEAHPLNVVGRLQRTCRKRIILESSNTPWTEKRGCFDTTAFTLPLRSQENGKK